jgi:hypothetical protein
MNPIAKVAVLWGTVGALLGFVFVAALALARSAEMPHQPFAVLPNQ